MWITPKEAIQELLKGNVVALPTETVYGLGGLATLETAVKKIYELKKRPKENPLICHIGKLSTIYEYSYISKEEEIFLEFFPGPLTILLKKRNIPDIVTAGSELCAFRMPSHSIFLEIAKEINIPISAPSANPFGKISPTTEEMVYEYFNESIPIVKGGKSEIGIESTIIRVVKKNTIQILRPGFFTKEFFIHKGFIVIENSKTLNTNQNQLLSPGLLPKHYSPSIPLILLKEKYLEYLRKENFKENLIKLLENAYQAFVNLELRQKKIGFLVYGKGFVNDQNIYNLSYLSNLQEIAKNLFSFLKEMEKLFDYIIAFEVPNKEIGFAINDRLRRASEFVL